MNNEEMIKKRVQAEFLFSAAYFKEIPVLLEKEFAVLGRSNVGKSSFINHVLENKNLARISKRPGKTTLANFYKIDNGTTWVDLPGYGYAKSPFEEKDRWSKLIAAYCEQRPNLTGIIWLIDMRHIGVKRDMEAFGWLKTLNKPFFPVLTKADKLTKNEKYKHLKLAKETFGFVNDPVTYSIEVHGSRELFWDHFDIWMQNL
jgi:GTP-binding protein